MLTSNKNDGSASSHQIKKLHIVVISTSVNAREIVATVPVRRIIELTKLTAVERLSLDQ